MKNDKKLNLKKINEYLFKNLKAFSLGFAMVFIVAQIGTALNIYTLTFLQEILDEGLGQADAEKIEKLIKICNILRYLNIRMECFL